MKTLISIAATTAAVLFAHIAMAQACPPGQSRLHEGDPCIASQLVDYLYCLSQSGGGKVEIVQRGDFKKNGNLEINIAGKGSGVVIKGEGSAATKNSSSSQAVSELSEKLDASLTSNCKQLAIAATTSKSSAAGKTQNANSAATKRKVASRYNCPDTDIYFERAGDEWVEYHTQAGQTTLFASYHESKRDDEYLYLADTNRSPTDTLIVKIPLAGGVAYWEWASRPDRWTPACVTTPKS